MGWNDAQDILEEQLGAKYGWCQGCGGPIDDGGDCVKMGCPDPELERTVEGALCPSCGILAPRLGVLGRTAHYRCKQCGLGWSKV